MMERMIKTATTTRKRVKVMTMIRRKKKHLKNQLPNQLTRRMLRNQLPRRILRNQLPRRKLHLSLQLKRGMLQSQMQVRKLQLSQLQKRKRRLRRQTRMMIKGMTSQPMTTNQHRKRSTKRKS